MATFQEQVRAARDAAARVEQGTLRRLHTIYSRAAVAAGEDAERLAGRKHKTADQQWAAAMNTALWARTQTIAGLVEPAVIDGERQTLDATAAPAEHVLLALTSTTWPPGSAARAQTAVRATFAAGQDRALLALVTRTTDGLTLSDRVWRAGATWHDGALAVVEDAVATNMDARAAATSLTRYLQPGANLAHKADTARRLGIPRDVSYPAMRLARTELHAAAIAGGYLAYRTVPTYGGVVWHLSPAHRLHDQCDALAQEEAHGRRGFYPVDLEPVPPHPQCLCWTEPITASLEDVADKLAAWADDPASEPEVERWYAATFRPTVPRPTDPPPPPAQPRIASGRPVRASLQSGVVRESKIGTTGVAEVAFGDGTAGIVRTQPSARELVSQRVADTLRDDLGYTVFPDAEVSAGRLYQRKVTGSPAVGIRHAPVTDVQEFLTREPRLRAAVESDDGRQIAVFDYLTAQGDRHEANWLIDTQGGGQRLWAIAHDTSHYAKTISPFAERWQHDPRAIEDVRRALPALESPALRAEYVRAGLEPHYDAMLGRARDAAEHDRFDPDAIQPGMWRAMGGQEITPP